MPINARAGSYRAVFALAVLAQFVVGLSPLSAQAAPLSPRAANATAVTAVDADVIPDQYIVLLAPDADARAEAEDVHQRHGVDILHVYDRGLRGFAFHGSRQAVDQLERSGRALAVSPDRLVHADVQTLPTGVQRVGADVNPIASIDGIDNRLAVNVAILDTGIDASHPDLQVVGGTNCMADFTSPLTDANGHGTHVAGTVGALDNAVGVVGVAPGVRLWSVRVLNATGGGTGSSLVCGIDWVTGTRTDADPNNDIAVANVSLSGGGGDTAPCGPNTTDAIHLAICRSVARGVVYAVAAGNSAADASAYFPASYPEVITVAAMTDFNGAPGGGAGATCRPGQDDMFAIDYSNWGPAVDIVAPGTCILSTAPGGGTATMTGTSMASPHVAGAAALYVVAHGMALDQAGANAIHLALTTPGGGWSVRQKDAHGFTGAPAGDPCHAPMLYIGPAPAGVHDVSISALGGPASVVAGDLPTLTVGVANDGDFAETISVTTTDSPSGVVLDQRSVSLRAAGCVTYSFTWNTSGAASGAHTITARAAPVAGETAIADNSRALSVSVTGSAPAPGPAPAPAPAPAGATHVTQLTGQATVDAHGDMNGIATVSLASSSGPTANAQVSGTFSNGNNLSVAVTCVTDATGSCSLQSGFLAISSLTFTVTNVSAAPGSGATVTYDPSANVASSIFIKHP